MGALEAAQAAAAQAAAAQEAAEADAQKAIAKATKEKETAQKATDKATKETETATNKRKTAEKAAEEATKEKETATKEKETAQKAAKAAKKQLEDCKEKMKKPAYFNVHRKEMQANIVEAVRNLPDVTKAEKTSVATAIALSVSTRLPTTASVSCLTVRGRPCKTPSLPSKASTPSSLFNTSSSHTQTMFQPQSFLVMLLQPILGRTKCDLLAGEFEGEEKKERIRQTFLGDQGQVRAPPAVGLGENVELFFTSS